MPRVLGLGLLIAAAVLTAGCGAGTSGSGLDWFDSGIPGGLPDYATLTGTVFQRLADGRILILGDTAVADNTRRVAPGVEISIPALKLTTLSDRLGRYKLTGITAGDHEVLVHLTPDLGGGTASFLVRFAAGETVQGIPTSPVDE